METKAENSPRRGTLARIAKVLTFVLLVVGAVLLSLDTWLKHSWSELSVDEVLYHLHAPLEGTDTTVIWVYLRTYAPIVVGIIVLAVLSVGLTARRGPAARALSLVAVGMLGVCMGGFALYDFAEFTGLRGYLDLHEEDFIGTHYINPANTEMVFPERKRNIIYIYLESVELTFADEANGGAFPYNCIPELCTLAREGDSFNGSSFQLNGGLVLPGTGWTMGAMFGQSSGVPLKLPFGGNSVGQNMEDFFPGLTTLGNILESQGYQNCLLIGSDADFAARGEFFREHGSFEIRDYYRALADGIIDPGYKVFWGFEDERLFGWAKTTLAELAASDKPFNLTMLTVDTHFEDGYVCRLCGTEHGDNQYANVMSCSSRQVSEFVRWCQQQSFYENTTIVICGDHTTMDSNFCDDVPEDYQRRTFTTILNSAAQCEDPTLARSYSTLDLFPTTLAAMGVQIAGDRLGLGTNLYSTHPTIVEEYGLDECTLALSRQSLFLDGFSDAQLGDMTIDLTLKRCHLLYDDGELGVNGFYLDNLSLINREMIEEAHLAVTDDRTWETTEYPLSVWQENPEDPNKYGLACQDMGLTAEDLQHLRVVAYVTVRGYEQQPFGSWVAPAAVES